MPLTVKRLSCGMAPTGVDWKLAGVTMILSPTPTPAQIASSLPSTMLKLPGVRSDSLPWIIRSAITETLRSSPGITARINAPSVRGPASMPGTSM